MSTWASRLSTAVKSASASPAAESYSGRAAASPASSSSAASPTNLGQGAAGLNAEVALREEFRRVAEKYNEESAAMLCMPPDCWDTVTRYLAWVDVVALGQTCRPLWLLLHRRESVWWRQLTYFHDDVRDLRGGKLLCTAQLFPRPSWGNGGAGGDGSQKASLLSSPTGGPVPSCNRFAGDSHASHTRPPPLPRTKGETTGGAVTMSAYERFFQERRVYVLDAHREWHFQELADVADKETGMFTVALHDGSGECLASPLPAEAGGTLSEMPQVFSITPPPPAFGLPRVTGSASGTPVLTSMENPSNPTPGAPPSPLSLMPPQQQQQQQQAVRNTSLTSAPTPPNRRITPIHSAAASIGNSPALAPSPAPPTPPLLPRVGEPIINEHNPPLHLRIFAIDVNAGTQRKLYASGEGDADERVVEGGNAAGRSGMSTSNTAAGSTASAPMNLAGMSEEQVLQYVMQLSLAEAEAEAEAARRSPQQGPRHLPGTNASQETTYASSPAAPQRRTHHRGAAGKASLPLSELLTVIDSINNNALDQLQRHQLRDCTSDEDPKFLRRLAETLRGAKHRRLHLGNHHRAVRNNGQTTRNRAGRRANNAAGAASPDGNNSFIVPQTAAAAGVGGGANAAVAPPQPPPPMNRMLRGFHGELLEITEREARMVASKLLGKPSIIDEFEVFHCHDPEELRQRLYPASAATKGTTTSATAAASKQNDDKESSQKHKAGPPKHESVSVTTETTWNASRLSAADLETAGEVAISDSSPLFSPAVGDVVDFPSAALSQPATAGATASSSTNVLIRAMPPLRPLPFFTRFFLAPELCHDGKFALIVADVVRVLVVVDKEVVSTDNPDWAQPVIDRTGRMVVVGQGYNAQAYTRDEYNYVPPYVPRRHLDPS